jgi:xanthine dehydrogenase accessory factor
MRELGQILGAFEHMAGEGRSAALATVIAVGGSSYRRPGARMLVAADGRTWGGISGGCLERDVARRGRGVIDSGQPVLCRYDTTETPDDQIEGDVLLDLGRSPGVTLGCRGVIDLFIERISAQSPGPIPLIARAVRERVEVRCATLLRKSASITSAPSTRFLPGGITLPDSGVCEPALVRSVIDLITCEPETKYGSVHHVVLSENESADLFIETLRPPQSLILFGSGSDVVPILELAKTLGWHVTIIAGAGSISLRQRFAAADALHFADNQDALAGVIPEPGAAVVLMTHDVVRDAHILRSLANRPLGYLGILGPRSRSERLLAQTGSSERPNAFSPAGLDLGADNPELIALAIVSEIQAVLANRPGGLLRDRPGPIYPREKTAP